MTASETTSTSLAARLAIGALLGWLARAAGLKALLTKATWEKACGTLPTRRPAVGSYSSLNKPTSLRKAISRSKRLRASSWRFCIM